MWVTLGRMQQTTFGISRAPVALAPAVRLLEPVLLEPVQEPLLPWPVPAAAVVDPVAISPRVQRIVSQLTAGVVEVLRGQRPLEHLAGHASADVHDLIGHLRRARSLSTLRLASMHVCQPSTCVVEVAVRLSLDGRSRAAALCFAEQLGRWRLVQLELALDPAVIVRAG